MRRSFLPAMLMFAGAMLGLVAQPASWWRPARQPASSHEQTVPQATPPEQQPATPPQRALRAVVLDPAHGGADAGAHSASGVLEKDLALFLAEALRDHLERQGLRVILTRHGNEDPTFDQRAGIANAQSGTIFLSLHVSSTGPANTVRVYYFDFASFAATVSEPASKSVAAGLLPWDRAQESHAKLSRRLAELLQVELAQKFRGSPESPVGAAVHQLRSIATPAIAVEVSSVAVPDAGMLRAMAPNLDEAVSRAIASFRPLYEAGSN